MRQTLTWALASTLVLLAGRASAQEPGFGEPGHVALSAERLFGYVHSKETQSMGGVDMSRSIDTFTLFTNPIGAASGYAWPRLALDAFVSHGVSVGGSLGLFYLSQDSASITGFLIAPRFGYAAMIGPRVAIWPRGGITYWHVSTDPGNGGTTGTQSAFALTIEAPLTILVAPRVGLLIGPTIDIGLGGSQGGGGASIDDKFTDFGLQAGVLLFI
jgi:hypothetical protein